MNLANFHIRKERQSRTLDIIIQRWGVGSTAERAERFFEEACELVQAEGIPPHRQHTIVAAVNRKAPGITRQEVGGASFTLLGYCEAAGISAEAEEVAEIERVAAMPIEDARARHEAKRASALVRGEGRACASSATLGILGEVAAERERQHAKGYDGSHDDREKPGAMTAGALTYALAGHNCLRFGRDSWHLMPRADKLWTWPWAAQDWKAGRCRRLLIKAIALLVAEVERMDRASAPNVVSPD